MATKIVTKNSSTASAVPTASDLVQGELAVNVADKRLFTEDNGGSIVELGTNPSTLAVDTDTLYVDSTNNRVGVGTTSPSEKLEIQEGNVAIRSSTISQETPFYFMRDDSGQTADYVASIGMQAASSSDWRGVITFNAKSGSAYNNTTIAERMRIDSSGNVGIGTTSPSTELHIASASPVLTLQDTDSTEPLSTYVSFKDSGGNEHGWMGYGSSSADSLQIANAHDDIILYTGSSGTAAERMRIDSSGNVGIGTSSPDRSLHVYESNTPTLATFQNDGGEALIKLQSANNSQGIIEFGDPQDGNQGRLVYNHSGSYMSMWTADSERMRIDSSGNLLVGTTVSPDSGDPTSVRYGIGVQAGSLSSTTTCTAGVITNVLDMANAVSGVNGAGLWLISVVRGGASYATHFTGVFGVNSSSMVLYQTIQSNGITVSVSGLNLRLSVSTTDGYRVNAIPLSINT